MIGSWARFPTNCVEERAETLIMPVRPPKARWQVAWTVRATTEGLAESGLDGACHY
jgi:hypothetical protein